MTQRRTRVCFMSGENLLRRAPHIHMFSQASREKSDSILCLFQRCPAAPWPPDLVATTAPRYTRFPPRFYSYHFSQTTRGNACTASRPSSPPFLSIKLYVALKIPVGMRKREFSRNIISSAISPHRCLINIGWPDPVPR